MFDSGEAFKHLTGWHFCTAGRSCQHARWQRDGDNISNILANDYNRDEIAPMTLVGSMRPRLPIGTPSSIIHGEMLTGTKGFLEIDQGFSVLPPQLFHFEESANTCGKIWILEVPNSINASADLTAKVYNYGKVRTVLVFTNVVYFMCSYIAGWWRCNL